MVHSRNYCQMFVKKKELLSHKTLFILYLILLLSLFLWNSMFSQWDFTNIIKKYITNNFIFLTNNIVKFERHIYRGKVLIKPSPVQISFWTQCIKVYWPKTQVSTMTLIQIMIPRQTLELDVIEIGKIVNLFEKY